MSLTIILVSTFQLSPLVSWIWEGPRSAYQNLGASTRVARSGGREENVSLVCGVGLILGFFRIIGEVNVNKPSYKNFRYD